MQASRQRIADLNVTTISSLERKVRVDVWFSGWCDAKFFAAGRR
jgi:hypothetical protein